MKLFNCFKSKKSVRKVEKPDENNGNPPTAPTPDESPLPAPSINRSGDAKDKIKVAIDEFTKEIENL